MLSVDANIPAMEKDGGGRLASDCLTSNYCIQGRCYIDLFTLRDTFHIEVNSASDSWEEGTPTKPLALDLQGQHRTMSYVTVKPPTIITLFANSGKGNSFPFACRWADRESSDVV
jgi:hypothetical protein